MQKQLLIERQKTAAYEKARTDLIAGISHDLRTPLTSVKGYIKGLQDGVAITPEKQERYLSIAYRKACDIDLLLQKLFYFSDLETGKLPLSLRSQDLGDFAHQFAVNMQSELEQKNIKIIVDATSGPHPVGIDTEQMNRVLINLTENAIKYANVDSLVLRISVWDEHGIYEAAIAQYGTGEPLAIQINRNPVLKFHFRYTSFGERVNTYWNGSEGKSSKDIIGIYPIQEKLKELEESNRTESYEYRYYRKLLNTELDIGEPYFVNAYYWNTLFIMFEGVMVIFLFMMVLTFLISPLFTQEVKTEMDSIILCSAKGRREIVTAKLLSAGVAAAIVSLIYLIAFFIGTWLGYGDLSGIDAPVRSLGGFGFSALNMTVGGAIVFAAGWLIFVSVAFALD
jgi:hypothetical protein